MSFPFAVHPEFPEFLVEWKAPLVNLFHTEHDPPDVIGLDNNTAMLFIGDFFFLYQKVKLSHNAAASPLSRPREGDSLAIIVSNIMSIKTFLQYL